MVSVDDIGPDWLLISWSVYDEIMTSITLAYSIVSSNSTCTYPTTVHNETVAENEEQYNITGLYGDTQYSIIVMATLVVTGSGSSEMMIPDSVDQTETNINTGGFKRNRGPMVVRLYRDNPSQVEGIYYCVVEDDTNNVHIVTVGLYNSVGGMYTPACIYCAFYYHC